MKREGLDLVVGDVIELAGGPRLVRRTSRQTPSADWTLGTALLAEGCARKGPSFKPCASMVTDHVIEIIQLRGIGVGLSGALHRLIGARDTGCGLAGPMRSLEANARR